MPYLKVSKQESKEDIKKKIEMPDVTGMKLSEAKNILKELGLEVEIEGEIAEEKVVTEQLPKKGIEINIGTTVTVYVEK